MRWSASTNQSGRTTVRVRHGRASIDVLRFNWRRLFKGSRS